MKKIFEEPMIECITLRSESITNDMPKLPGEMGSTDLPDGWE